MPCGSIAFYNSIKLQNAKAQSLCRLHTVQHQCSTDMLSPLLLIDCKAGIAYMSAATYIIRMQDIQPRQHSILIDTDTRLALRGKKDIAALFIQLLQLRTYMQCQLCSRSEAKGKAYR